jgi:chromate transporter
MGKPVSSQPSLASIFMGFVRIGLASFGGGLTAWIRLEVVQRRAWLDDPQFLSGYALSQLVPGATNANLAIFIGTQLRGALGAAVAIAGLTVPPLILVLIAGAIYFHSSNMPGGTWLSAGLGGMGAVAIGLSLGTGVRLARRNIRRLVPACVTAAVTLSIGVFRVPLLEALAVLLPVSLLLAWWDRRA